MNSFIEYPYTNYIRPAILDMVYGTDEELGYFPPIYHGDFVMEGREGWLYYRGDNNIDYYEGTNKLTSEELELYATTLQELNSVCEAKGIQLQIAIWPNKEQIYPEHLPTLEVQNEYKRVEEWTDYVKNNTNVKIIYPLDLLKESKICGSLYYKYDTHWNKLGGMIGYQEMLKSMDMETTDINTLPYKVANSVIEHDLINLGQLDPSIYSNDIYYDLTYRPHIEVIQHEETEYFSHTTSNGPNDLNFVLLGDSYRLAMMEYAEKDFTDVVIAHRQITGDAIVKDAIKNADIIVLTSVERYDWAMIKNAREIIDILLEVE